MAQATGRWGEVIQTANDWLQEQTEADQKIRLCLHLAKWYGDDLGHPEYAQPYYAQIVALDPNNVGALRQMGQLYRKNGNWQQLGATLTRALDVAVSDVDRKEILTELGELLDSQMNQTDQAVDVLPARARGRPAVHPGASRTSSASTPLAARTSSSSTCSRRKVRRARQSPPRSRRRSCASARSTSRLQRHRRRPRRRTARSSRSSRRNLQGLRGLARVYEALEQWPELVKVLESAARRRHDRA